MPIANDFQDGIIEARARVKDIIGKRITADKDDAFVGHWDGPQNVSGRIECVLHHGSFVAGVRFDGEGLSTLTAASLMLSTTKWDWDHIDARDDEQPLPQSSKHDRSMHRAYRLASEIIRRVGAMHLKGKYIVILDGNGENRRAIENAFNDLNIPTDLRPIVITLELDPNVAFANALRFGRKHVRLTSSDFHMQVKKNDVCGIERAILLDGHSVLTSEEKDNCVGLYLDYCGSPSKLTDFDALYVRLPQLAVCAITVAKRQPNHNYTCEIRRDMAVPPKERFVFLQTYDHNKVFCDMYARPDTDELHEQQLEQIAKIVADKEKSEKAVARANQNVQKRHAMASIKKGKKISKCKEVQKFINATVGIPNTFWPNGDPGPAFDGVLRNDNKLYFKIDKSFYGTKCALRAIMKDRSLHPSIERFWLTPEEVVSFME